MDTSLFRSTLTGFILATLPPAIACADVKPDGKRSLGGSGEMIQLQLPPENRTLTGIEIHGSRYGTPTPPKEKFLIYVLSSDESAVIATRMAPYSLFERGEEKWVAVKFNRPLEYPKDSWIVLDFRAGRTKGVYVSYDSDTEGNRSRIGLPGIESRETGFQGDWMIRPLVAK